MAEVAYIDPNPEGLGSVNLEDLSIFVELLTTKKERSQINVDGEEKTYQYNAGGKKTPIRFLKGSDIDGDGRNELTTHYTEINTNFNKANPDLETLGITGIDIDFNSAYTPLIKINFTDVRGQLFEMGNDSPYNVFFNLPYPIFELTIKGYYGNAVKYCLHLTKFSGKLDDKTGNFEIQCEFVGYTYAFLADMLMGLLRGVVETRVAKEKIIDAKRKAEEMGLTFLPFNELNEKIKKLNKEVTKLKHNDEQIAKLALAEDSLIAISGLKTRLSKLISQLVSTTDINDDKTVEILNLDSLAVFRNPTSDISRQNIEALLRNYNETVADKVADINTAVKSEKYKINPNELTIFEHKKLAKGVRLVDFQTSVYEDIGDPNGEGYINNATKGKKIPNADSLKIPEQEKKYVALDFIKNNRMDNETAGTNKYYNDIKDRLDKIPNGIVSPQQLMWVVDARNAFKHIEDIENLIRNDQKATKEAVSNELVEQIEEIFGFKPTIKNMVYILTEHVHILMQCIKDVGQQVQSTIDNHIREEHLEKLIVDKKWDVSDSQDTSCRPSTASNASGGELNDILPFPDYKEKNVKDGSFEDKWIGRKAPMIPEVMFIEQLLEGLLTAKRKDNELLDELEFGEDEWYPINAFDTKFANGWNNPWKLFKNTIDPNEVIRHMLLRASIFLGYSHTKLNEKEIKAMAKIEANNAFNNIESPDIRANIGHYEGAIDNNSLYSKVSQLSRKDGHLPWRNAARIWNGDRLFTNKPYNVNALGFISEYEIIGDYNVGNLASDVFSVLSFGLTDQNLFNDKVKILDEYTYISVPDFTKLSDFNIPTSGLAKLEGTIGADGSKLPLAYQINITDYKRMAADNNNPSISDRLKTKYYLPLSTPNENDRDFFRGNQIMVKSGDSILSNLTTNSDRIALRDSGKIFFGSFIGGNSATGWQSKRDDGSTTIKVINSGDYDNTPQFRYPELREDILADLKSDPTLDMSNYDSIPDDGMFQYSGMFAGKWKTHEFRVVELGEDFTFEGFGSQVPAWLRFYAATTSHRPIFTSQRRLSSNDEVKTTPYDIVINSDGTFGSSIKKGSAIDKTLIKKYGLNPSQGGIFNASFIGNQSEILNARNDNDFGKTHQVLLEGTGNGAIPFLGFEVYHPRSSTFDISATLTDIQSSMFTAQYPIFGTDLYFQQEIEGKAYLFLHSFPWDGMVYLFEEGWLGKVGNSFDNIFDACGDAEGNTDGGSQCNRGGGLFSHHVQHLFNQRSGFVEVPYLWACFLGAILWRYRSSEDPLVWERNGYNLIPLSKRGEGIPSKNKYCLPNIKTNEVFGFFSARDEFINTLESIGNSALNLGANNLINNDKVYVAVERVISRMPEGMGQIFIDMFLEFANGKDFEDIRREYDIFFKEDGTYPTEDERIELWLKWPKELFNDPNALFNDSSLNPNIPYNYIIASRDDKYATYFSHDVPTILTGSESNIGVNNKLYKEMITHAATNNVAGAKLSAQNYEINASPFNFFLEMRDGGDRINGSRALGGQKKLFDLLNRTNIIINSSRRLWAANAENVDDISASHPFRWEPSQLSIYVRNFFDEYKKLLNDERETLVDEDEQLKRELFNSVDADDIKLQLYKTIKSIYDKWVPGSKCELELCGSGNSSDDDCPQLIDTFRFIDRAYNDIGNEFFVDPIKMVVHMLEDYNISMYDYLARALVDNNFDFIPLPTFINYNNPDAIKDVFTPEPFNSMPLASGPQFVCMYIGERSKHLNLGEQAQHMDDGFDISKEECRPADFTNVSGSSSTFVPAFRVAYGDQNQSIFKNFKLDQSEFTETEESLQIIDELSSEKLSSAGQNLFNVYRTRSYSTTIDTLGNAQIQPFMYFQLDNVPMFAGAYTIIHVKHSIKPNHMSTQFKGVRVRRAKTKMVEKTTLFMNLIGSLTDVDTAGATLDGLVDSTTSTSNLRVYPVPNNVGAPAYSGCITYKLRDNKGLIAQTSNNANTLSSCKTGVITPYGIEEVGKYLEFIGNKWNSYAKGKGITEAIYYNDFSMLGGGNHPCHKTHEEGRDIDVRMIANKTGNISFTITSNIYNRAETINFIKLILDEALIYEGFKADKTSIVEVMYFNDVEVINAFKNYKGYGRDMIKFSEGHDNHIHIKFGLPDRIENDKANGYLVCKEKLSTDNFGMLEQITRSERAGIDKIKFLGKV